MKIVKTNINFKELSINKAYECYLPKNEIYYELLDFITKLKNKKKLDVNIIKSESIRRKKLLLADMDSTIIKEESLDELAKLIGKEKEITEISHNLSKPRVTCYLITVIEFDNINSFPLLSISLIRYR